MDVLLGPPLLQFFISISCVSITLYTLFIDGSAFGWSLKKRLSVGRRAGGNAALSVLMAVDDVRPMAAACLPMDAFMSRSAQNDDAVLPKAAAVSAHVAIYLVSKRDGLLIITIRCPVTASP